MKPLLQNGYGDSSMKSMLYGGSLLSLHSTYRPLAIIGQSPPKKKTLKSPLDNTSPISPAKLKIDVSWKLEIGRRLLFGMSYRMFVTYPDLYGLTNNLNATISECWNSTTKAWVFNFEEISRRMKSLNRLP